MTFGPVGLGDVELIAPYEASDSGDEVSFTAQFTADTPALWRAQAQQLVGCANNPDERAFELTFDRTNPLLDPAFIGWYEPLDIAVDRPLAGEHACVGELSMTLRRITGYSAPRIESLFDTWILANTIPVTDGYQRPHWAIPSALIEFDGPAGGTWGTRQSSTGELRFWWDSRTDTNRDGFADSLFWCPAEGHAYDGAATIECKLDDDSDWFTITGLWAPNQPQGWRLGNGCVRCWWDGTTLRFEWYDGSVWETQIGVNLFGSLAAGDLATLTSATPIRNSSEECVIRTTWFCESVETMGRVVVDLVLRRGSRMVTGILKCDTADKWAIQEVTETNCNTITGGLLGAAINGNRFLLMSADTVTKTTADALMVLDTSSTSFVFGVGCEIGGSGSSTPNNYASELLGFLAAGSERKVIRER